MEEMWKVEGLTKLESRSRCLRQKEESTSPEVEIGSLVAGAESARGCSYFRLNRSKQRRIDQRQDWCQGAVAMVGRVV